MKQEDRDKLTDSINELGFEIQQILPYDCIDKGLKQFYKEKAMELAEKEGPDLDRRDKIWDARPTREDEERIFGDEVFRAVKTVSFKYDFLMWSEVNNLIYGWIRDWCTARITSLEMRQYILDTMNEAIPVKSTTTRTI